MQSWMGGGHLPDPPNMCSMRQAGRLGDRAFMDSKYLWSISANCPICIPSTKEWWAWTDTGMTILPSFSNARMRLKRFGIVFWTGRWFFLTILILRLLIWIRIRGCSKWLMCRWYGHHDLTILLIILPPVKQRRRIILFPRIGMWDMRNNYWRRRWELARPVKKQPEQWKKEILDAAKELFLSKGYEETAITDIMELLFVNLQNFNNKILFWILWYNPTSAPKMIPNISGAYLQTVQHVSQYVETAGRIAREQKEYFTGPLGNDVFQCSPMPWVTYTHISHTNSGKKHPQKNDEPGQIRAWQSYRPSHNTSPSQTKASHYPFFRNWYVKYAYR